MTARGGADSVPINRSSTVSQVPYCSADTGSGPAKLSVLPALTLLSDDGTAAWFGTDSWVWVHENPTAFGVNSTPDEHALLFEVEQPMIVSAVLARLASVAASDDFEFILYTDPRAELPRGADADGEHAVRVGASSDRRRDDHVFADDVRVRQCGSAEGVTVWDDGATRDAHGTVRRLRRGHDHRPAVRAARDTFRRWGQRRWFQ
jgi:hypothetical protein